MADVDLKKIHEFILAGMVASEDFYPVRFSSVQIQKLFFLLDKKIRSELKRKPYFNFVPYDYGPYDIAVYDELENLEDKGLIEIKYINTYAGLRKEYNLTHQGVILGKKFYSKCDGETQQKILSNLQRVLSHQSFRDLVLDIYKEYPEMRENSIFK